MWPFSPAEQKKDKRGRVGVSQLGHLSPPLTESTFSQGPPASGRRLQLWALVRRLRQRLSVTPPGVKEWPVLLLKRVNARVRRACWTVAVAWACLPDKADQRAGRAVWPHVEHWWSWSSVAQSKTCSNYSQSILNSVSERVTCKGKSKMLCGLIIDTLIWIRIPMYLYPTSHPSPAKEPALWQHNHTNSIYILKSHPFCWDLVKRQEYEILRWHNTYYTVLLIFANKLEQTLCIRKKESYYVIIVYKEKSKSKINKLLLFKKKTY